MKLNDLIKGLDCVVIGDVEVEISGLCADSRLLSKGDLFFCYQGTKVDAHRFAKDAELRGASAIVCETECAVNLPQIIVKEGRESMSQLASAFFKHPAREMKTVGITGTNGKTTTAHMLYSILQSAGKKVGLIGTLGAKYGEITVPPDLTTPDPIFLFSLLREMCDAGVEYVVMEVSAHALALKKVRPILFDVAIFTNLTQDHLDFFESMEEYGRAKSLLFTPEQSKVALVNGDDPFSKEIAGIPQVSYGLETPCEVFAVVEEEGLWGCRALLNISDELFEISLRMTGRHNLYNALASSACACLLGVKEGIVKGLCSLSSVEGRLEWVAKAHEADIFVDFAHTPDGLEKSLSALKKYCRGKLVCLFGCGGNRDVSKRPVMGETVAKGCDFAVITSDNPRYEDPCAIMAQIEEGYKRVSKEYVCVQNREKAISYAMRMLEKGDILLVAGKGGEHYQEIMGIKYDYNDKTVIERLLGGR